jgi:hypothetical protein
MFLSYPHIKMEMTIAHLKSILQIQKRVEVPIFSPKISFLLKYLNSISSPCSIFPLLLVDPELSTF